LFVKLHNKNILGAKFSIGDKVDVKDTGLIAEITGINCIDVNEYEYSLKGFTYLYYEDELEFPEDN